MAEAIPRFEAGATKEFTITYSVAPGITPALTIRVGSDSGSVAATPTVNGSQGVAADSGRIWTGYWTMPSSRMQLYTFTWVTSFAVGPVLHRGWFQVVATIPG